MSDDDPTSLMDVIKAFLVPRMAEIQRKNDRDLVDRLARIETQIKLLLKHERGL